MNAEAKMFDAGKYTFDYPAGCKIEKKENRFTARDATLDCEGQMTFIFEGRAGFSDTISGYSDQDLLSNMEDVIERVYDAQVFESGTEKYVINNETAPYVVATFSKTLSNIFGYEKTFNYVAMALAVKIGDDTIIVQYLNDENGFDKGLPKAEKLFQSIKEAGNATVTETSDDTDTNTNKETYNSNQLPNKSNYCNSVNTQLGKELCDKLLS
jgi:hypothetical protein